MNNIKVQNDEGRWYILSDKHMQEVPNSAEEKFPEDSRYLRTIRRSNIKRFFSHGGDIQIRYTGATDVNSFFVDKHASGAISVGCSTFSPSTVETIKKWAQVKTARRKKHKAAK